MKKLLVLLLPLSVLFLGCEGDTGPPGPPGQPGNSVVGQTFEIENINFNYVPGDNLFSNIITIPSDIEVLESDAILAYRLEINQGVETWSQIPQNFYLPDDRSIQYLFNHSEVDIELLITGNFDLNTLSPDFTDNEVFRFVVVPSDFSENPNIDVTTYQSLMESTENYGKSIEKMN